MDTQPEPLSVNIQKACQLTGLGETTIAELIAAGHLDTLKVGKRRLIRYASLSRLIAEGLPRTPGQKRPRRKAVAAA